jgi:hypothetical protein
MRQMGLTRCYQCAPIQLTMPPTRFHVQNTQIFSLMGVYYYRRARTRVTHSRTRTHSHAHRRSHHIALTLLNGEFCRYAQVDVTKAPNRCRTRRSARMRTLRRQSHNTCQRGQKWIREGEGPGGHSEGSREVPMVRAPAGPLGSRTPSRGRSQRRDTGRGPVGRCMHVSTHGSSSSKADARLSRLSHASAPETQTDGLQELASAIILVSSSSFGSRNSRNRKHLSMSPCRILLLMGNSAH